MSYKPPTYGVLWRKFANTGDNVEKINALIPILTNSDLDFVRGELDRLVEA